LTSALSEGNPTRAWEVSQAILKLTSELIVESARLRFKIEFGTPRCRNCTGLKAGPGVVATCYQVQQCYYTNIREDDLTVKQARIVDYLAGSVKSTR